MQKKNAKTSNKCYQNVIIKSYGGQITSHVLGYSDDSNPNPFKCGIAVAPGASYRFYGL